MSIHYHLLKKSGATLTIRLRPTGRPNFVRCGLPLRYLQNHRWVWLDGTEGSPDPGYCTAAMELEEEP